MTAELRSSTIAGSISCKRFESSSAAESLQFCRLKLSAEIAKCLCDLQVWDAAGGHSQPNDAVNRLRTDRDLDFQLCCITRSMAESRRTRTTSPPLTLLDLHSARPSLCSTFTLLKVTLLNHHSGNFKKERTLMLTNTSANSARSS